MLGRKDDDRPTSRGALLIAVAVSSVVGLIVPFGSLLLYPFTLLNTWVHEMGHGVTALVVGGGFDSLEIYADASGLAMTRIYPGVQAGLVAAGGLLGPPVIGAAMLAIARGPKRAHGVLLALAIALVVSLTLYVRSLAGLIAVPIVAALVAVFVRWGSPRERMFLAQFIGLRLAIDTLGRGLDYIWTDEVVIQGAPQASDIAGVAQNLGGPRVVWSVLISLVCLLLVAAGLVAAWRKPASAGAGLRLQR